VVTATAGDFIGARTEEGRLFISDGFNRVAFECLGDLLELGSRSVAVLRMRNGTSKSPFRLALGDSPLCPGRPASAAATHFLVGKRSATAPTNGSTASRMRLHRASARSGTFSPCAATAPRPRLRLPGTTRLVLRTSLAGSG
jgi:hypothetical protein